MATKFQNKYRNESARWQYWDYADPGAYFITIVTKNRIDFFGEIVSGNLCRFSHKKEKLIFDKLYGNC